jgi:hypothetical protein
MDGQNGWLPAYIPRFSEGKAGDQHDRCPGTLIYNSPGWVGGRWMQVECRYNHPDYDLNVEGSSHFLVCEGGKAVVRIRGEGDPSSVDILDWEVLHGPVLVLALAMQGIWCLHASSVARDGHSTIFLGDSGDGKSTLAAYLDGQLQPAWQRIADDILPVTLVDGTLEARPGFPQLKLPLKAQPAFQVPASLTAERIFVLHQVAKTARPEVKPLAPRQAAQELLRHTAGARLFAPDLLARHLGFCGQIAGKVPVYRLEYPHTIDALGQVKNLLE